MINLIRLLIVSQETIRRKNEKVANKTGIKAGDWVTSSHRFLESSKLDRIFNKTKIITEDGESKYIISKIYKLVNKNNKTQFTYLYFKSVVEKLLK